MKSHDEIRELLIPFVLGQLSQEEASDITRHLVECQECGGEVKRLGTILECARQTEDLTADEQLSKSAKETILAAAEEADKAKPKSTINMQNVWRIIMKSRMTKLAAAAVITAALTLSICRFGGSIEMESVAFAGVSEPILAAPSGILMLSGDDTYIILLLAMNLVVGFGCAVPIARLFAKIEGKPKRVLGYFVILIGIYFLESVAFGAGTTAHIISLGLSFVWGIIFGLRLRTRASAREALKQAFLLSLYSCLPAISFYLFIPAAKLVTGRHILSAAEGASLGIPGWLPWPINTILGFYAALVIGTVVFKTVITTGEVSLLIHLGEKSWKKISTVSSVIVAICALVIIALAVNKPCGPPGLVITGTVTDAKTGQPIAGARVSDGRYGPKPSWDTIQAGDCAPHGAITDSKGEYRYLTWGEHHSIEAQAVGYKTQRKTLYKGHLGDFFDEEKEKQKVINFALELE